MILEEYDEEKHMANEKAISYEEGYQIGYKIGVALPFIIKDALRRGKTCEEIADFLDIPIEKVREVSLRPLDRNRAEATARILDEYDEEKHIANEKAISFEEGAEQVRLYAFKKCIECGMSEEEAGSISGYTGEKA